MLWNLAKLIPNEQRMQVFAAYRKKKGSVNKHFIIANAYKERKNRCIYYGICLFVLRKKR